MSLRRLRRSSRLTQNRAHSISGPISPCIIEYDQNYDEVPPPAFHEIDASPPNFTPYLAECKRIDIEDNIVSHDSHLNTDGEALYRFMIEQALTPPRVYLHCRGTHFEYGSEHGIVTDFDFLVSLNDHVHHKVDHWTVADDEPAYRGHDILEVEGNGGTRREARREEKKAWKSRWSDQIRRGLPPWIARSSSIQSSSDLPEFFHSTQLLSSSKTIREWADEYCACEDTLKEFCYQKVIYGWNLDLLSESLRQTISKYNPESDICVNIVFRGSKVSVRSNNRCARALSNVCMRDLLTVTLVYPVILAFKRLSPKLGARWEVCGGGYRLMQDKTNEAEKRWLGQWTPGILREVRMGNKSRRPI
ncbi:hypothetical protein K435DRAFT_791560 [Dendrothele bispora CBS 962.96]|uniref:Uncharacterized protein n=1 Tax=Dendrothele bispora (strain CBS 962.96) TaxID=1314807 RepID=A0A4S8MLQ0_DENBC|nr:hypothetical protein K435DRAFT_791560 [Dendrothele bispora CBS 962.96]